MKSKVILISFMPLKFTKPELIKSLIFLVILAVVTTLFNIPMYQNISKIYTELKNEKESLAMEYQLGNYFEKSYQDYQELEKKIPAYSSLFSSLGSELELITNLEELAANNNLKQHLNLSNLRIDFSAAIEKLGLSIKLNGRYEDLVSYLRSLEEMKFKLTVHSLELKQEPTEGLTAELLTNTYWLR